MAATAAVVGEFFTGTAAADAGITAAATTMGEGLATASVGAGAGMSAGAGALAGGAAAAGGSSAAGTMGTAAASAVASSVAAKALGPHVPNAPTLPTPVTMPDPLAQEAATRKSLVEQLVRRGRASTILTDAPAAGKLGG